MAMFTAKCTQGKYKEQYLSFHSFLLNIGNDFDLNSGTFTTPITGIYELYSIGNLDSQCTGGCTKYFPVVKIMKNNENVHSFSGSGDGVYYGQTTRLLPLHKGDKIRIYISKPANGHQNAYSECTEDLPGIFNGKYLGPM